MSEHKNHNDKLQKDSKQLKNDNPFNPKTNIKVKVKDKTKNSEQVNLNNLNPYTNHPIKNKKNIGEEEKKKKEEEEKEKNIIRDKLKCYICFGKVINATMCPKCKKIACEECIKKMLSKNNDKCYNCNNTVKISDMIKLPFMDDLTSFFINKVEKKNQKKEHYEKNIYNNDNNIDQKESIIIPKNIICKYHSEKNVEYYCFDCNEYLCSKCLIFLNSENVAKHKKHIILSIDDLNEFNLGKIIEEYKNLSDIKKDSDKESSFFNLKIQEIGINKKMINEIFNSIRLELESKYSKKVNEMKYIMKLLKNKQNDINTSIKEYPNFINRVIKENKLLENSKKIQNDLKKFNNYPSNLEGIQKRSTFPKNIYFESYKSDIIEIKIPNDGKYLEELYVLNTEFNFIPDTKIKVTIQLLGGSIVFSIIFPIKNDSYEKHQTNFYGYVLFFGKISCEYAIFSYYNSKDGEILSVDFDFSKIKKLLDENYKCKLEFHIFKKYYK